MSNPLIQATLRAHHKQWLTVEEAATLAGVSAQTVRRAVARGRLEFKAARGPTKLLFHDDVAAWIQERSRGPQIRLLDDDECPPVSQLDL